MSEHSLEILNASGHLTLTWNDDDPAEVAAVREEVARLKAAGYSFFLVDNTPADAVTAGKGHLLVRRVVDPTQPVPEQEPEVVATVETETDADEDRPVNPRKGKPLPRRTVAVRPMQGGGR